MALTMGKRRQTGRHLHIRHSVLLGKECLVTDKSGKFSADTSNTSTQFRGISDLLLRYDWITLAHSLLLQNVSFMGNTKSRKIVCT